MMYVLRQYATQLDESDEEQQQFKVRILDLLDRSQQLDQEIAALTARWCN